MQSLASKMHLHSHVRWSKVGNLASRHSVILQTHWHEVGSKIGNASGQSSFERKLHSHAQVSGLKIGLSTVQES